MTAICDGQDWENQAAVKYGVQSIQTIRVTYLLDTDCVMMTTSLRKADLV